MTHNHPNAPGRAEPIPPVLHPTAGAELRPALNLASRLVLLVNGSRARLFELKSDEPGLEAERWQELRDWVWPPRRQSADEHHLRQTGRERHGHLHADSLVPMTSPEALDHARFARLLARSLTIEPRFEAAASWVMLASPAMLGAMRRHLPESALQRLSWSADVDLTACSPRTLSRSLRALQRVG
jgi:protein required for attachment to host cells